MYILIQFEDGSDPWYSFGHTRETAKKIIEEWEKNYDMKFLGKMENGLWYRAKAKGR